jgi:hypothetical protein
MAGGLGAAQAPRSSGINGAKSCILGLSWDLISLLKLKIVRAGKYRSTSESFSSPY